MTLVVPEHLGAFHPFETAMVALLAFGPFVVLGVVVHRQRRRESSSEDDG